MNFNLNFDERESHVLYICTPTILSIYTICTPTILSIYTSVKEIIWSEGPWSGEELEKAWENYYEVQGYLPFAICGNDQCRNEDLYVLTSAASPSTSFSCPLHAPFTPFTPGSQVPGVDSPCSPLHQVQAWWHLPK